MLPLEHLGDFAETWLGRSLTPSDGITVPDSMVLPEALREVYQTFGAVHQLTRAHNELLNPSEIVSEDGYSIFYDENQLVVRWAFRNRDRSQNDPIVYQGTTQASGYEWYSEEMRISAWIRVMTLWQLVNGGYQFTAYSSGIIGATQIVEEHYPRVAEHADGTTSYYGLPGQLLCLAGPIEIPSIWAGGSTTDAFQALCSTVNFDWDYRSDED